MVWCAVTIRERPRTACPQARASFLACSFWLVDNLVLLGRLEDARSLFERLLALRNDLGLLSEEYDPAAKRLVGNFPQAFSHIALINSAYNLARAAKPAEQRSGRQGSRGGGRSNSPCFECCAVSPVATRLAKAARPVRFADAYPSWQRRISTDCAPSPGKSSIPGRRYREGAPRAMMQASLASDGVRRNVLARIDAGGPGLGPKAFKRQKGTHVLPRLMRRPFKGPNPHDDWQFVCAGHDDRLHRQGIQAGRGQSIDRWRP